MSRSEVSHVANKRVILGLSGGVDSAVAAILLQRAGADVQALHMTNWEDDDGYCTAADDLQDARNVCEQLGIPLHNANFSKQYRDQVFEYFLAEYRAGRTPNPDVLCNRDIKFGVFRDYAKRLGGDLLATGHYARSETVDGHGALFKGADRGKDQSYFLHAVNAEALSETVFPLGDTQKSEVRRIARDSGLTVHDKKDSTGICFIGERPFRKFLSTYLPANPGPMRTPRGEDMGRHQGLMYYTLGQRQGLGIGGRNDHGEEPWYVVGKDLDDNVLVVAQGEHEMLFSDWLIGTDTSWIGVAPDGLAAGLRCTAKIRYRQADQNCVVTALEDSRVKVRFDERQKAVAPGQFVVFYDQNRCLGGSVIHEIG
ncbi:MAG: tRNA 2-thiouridine(34) synthase MnmA [Proteobacteria bacterium]|nr:tRNA 2-thiouridine(34) synthase MnmA [Pseudomonadota bacterium]